MQDGESIPMLVDAGDHAGVLRAARDLQSDIKRVTSVRPELLTSAQPPAGAALIVGTLGHSAPLDDLVERGKPDVSEIAGRWESFVMEVVDAPMPGVERALVILSDVIGREAAEVPQIWALYKEVQEYYERGMRVPDDVTLWADDNWGNIRRLPTAEERERPGAGVYYHFDYVGGPRSYKWLNTVPLTKIQEQMHLAWRYAANRIWIVNVGDLKPMEFPLEFFLRMAWDPARWPYERLDDYSRAWAVREFGDAHAAEVAALINGYTKLNGRRKPEMLSPDTYSLVNYREADRVLEEWRDLVARAEQLEAQLPEAYHDAFFQLVLYPVKASAVVHELYVAGRSASKKF